MKFIGTFDGVLVRWSKAETRATFETRYRGVTALPF